MIRKHVLRFAYFMLRLLGRKYYPNPSSSVCLLFKHLFMQKVLRLNHHVPWPVHFPSVVTDVEKTLP